MSTKTIVGGNSVCAECQKFGELRPYGKNGAWICFSCGMKDKSETERQFSSALDADVTIIDARNQHEH